MADDWGDPQPRAASDVTGDGKPYTPPAGLRLEVPGRGRRQTDTAAGSLRQQTVDFWKGKGAPEHVAEGIADRVAAESGFRPTIPGDSGTSVGLYQHHADRMEKLQKQPNWQDPMTQHGFAYSEVTGGDSIATKHWDEILGAPNRAEAAKLWDKYFERSAGGVGKGGGSDWDAPARITRTDKPGGRFADEGVAFTQDRPRTRMFWVDPQDYINDREEQSDKETKPKRRSLAKSLALGDDIEVPPEFQGEIKGGKLVLTGGDGAQRARAFAEAGGTLMPVAVTGIPKDGDLPKEYTNLRGETKPLDWTPMQPVKMEAPVSSRVTAAQGGQRNKSSIPSTFPFNVPGVEYGNVLPFAVNPQTKEMGFAAPEAIRAPVRSVIEMGERAMGVGEAGQDPLRPLSQEQILTLGGAEVGRGMGSFQSRVPVEPAPVNALATAPVAGPVNALTASSPLENQARAAVSERFGDRAAGTGAVPMDIVNRLAGARAEGQPLTLADVPELQGMAGTVARVPGEAGGRMRSFFQQRKDAALQRLDNILAKYLPTGSVKRTMEELAEERSAKARPVYEEAFAGGSLAPLETQFQKEWTTAGQVAKNAEQNASRITGELNQALARQSQAGNVYSSSGANRAVKFAEDKVAEQRKIAEQARAAEQTAMGRLRQAQQDGTASAPGAVWSPVIQRLLGNPRVQQGIRHGMKIERDLADAEGRPMSLREYAIVGTDQAGEPIVGAVPNMRLLAAAKQGLDSILEQPAMRHELTGRLTQEGRAVNMLRKALIDELYALNPKYKEANQIWGGYIESMRAMKDGQKALDRNVSIEDVRDTVRDLSEANRDFYRLGVADEARKDLQNTSLTQDKSKAIVNTPAAREKLRAIIGSPEDAERFIQAVDTERSMFNTDRTITGGSQTAERLAEDSGGNALAGALHLVHGIGNLAHGRMISGGASLGRAYRELKTDPRLAKNPDLASEVSKLLTDPDIALQGRQGSQILPQLMMSLPQTSNALRRGAGQLQQRAQQNALARWSAQFQNPTMPLR